MEEREGQPETQANSDCRSARKRKETGSHLGSAVEPETNEYYSVFSFNLVRDYKPIGWDSCRCQQAASALCGVTWPLRHAGTGGGK
jgi:hypothetical protein